MDLALGYPEIPVPPVLHTELHGLYEAGLADARALGVMMESAREVCQVLLEGDAGIAVLRPAGGGHL